MEASLFLNIVEFKLSKPDLVWYNTFPIDLVTDGITTLLSVKSITTEVIEPNLVPKKPKFRQPSNIV